MQDSQDLITYQGRGAPAAGRGSGRGDFHSGRGRGRGRGRSSEALIAFPRKVCKTSCDCASNCWIQEPGKAPHPVQIPTSAEEFLSGGPLVDEINSRRNSSGSSSTSFHEIFGAEESKGDASFPPPSRSSSMDLPTPRTSSRLSKLCVSTVSWWTALEWTARIIFLASERRISSCRTSHGAIYP